MMNEWMHWIKLWSIIEWTELKYDELMNELN